MYTTNISDHFPIFSRERTRSLTEDVMIIKYKIFSDECMLKFKNSLQLNWQTILNNDDPTESYELFQSTSIFHLTLKIFLQ